MLNQIKPLRSAGNKKSEDAVDLLMGCHERIRHFTAMAVKLAHAQGSTPEEIRRAADAIYRYYTVSLPLHEADEDDSLHPRLRELADERLRKSLLAMADQHLAIDDLLERLLPLLQLVSRNPQAIHEAGPEMCSITRVLDKMFRAHLEMEEEAIFPAIRQTLPVAQQAELLREMQQRRRQG